MAAFPLYSPLICPPGWQPDFAAGSEACALQTGDVSRARLVAGGSLFRSVETAGSADVNNIILQLIVGTPVSVGDIDTSSIDLIISGPMVGSPTITISSTQAWNTNTTSCVAGGNGVSNLRAAVLLANTIITMPPIDTTVWTDSTCLMASFGPTNMSGGIGLPIYSSSIRTGPTYALFHVANADTAEDGTFEAVDAISEWDGINNKWISHPSTLYEVGDPAPCP